MKKKILKLAAAVLAAVMMVNTFPQSVKAEEGFTYEFEKNCKAYYMFDPTDESVVYSVNADEVLPMASLTKIMTFIVASENIPDIEDTVVTVSDIISVELEDTQSSLAGVYSGEELTVLQLLNMMMIPSGNDAALALQIYYEEEIAGVEHNNMGKNSPFIDLMNSKAKELGCTNTHFVNSHGLHDEEHYSTARDLGKIVQYALSLPYFKEIVNTTEYTVPATNISDEERTIEATNKMLRKDYENGAYYYEYANGVKTGSHNEAGYCIAASATKDDQNYVAIVLGSPMLSEVGEYIDYHGEMIDAAELFDWGFENLSRQELCGKDDVISEAPLQYAWKQKTIDLVPDKSATAILPNDVTEEDLEIDLEVPELVQTPVEEGATLGKVTYSYNGEVLAEVNLNAAETVKKSNILYGLAIIKSIVTSIWFWLVIVLIVAVILIYNEQERQRRLRRKRRKQSKISGKRRASQKQPTVKKRTSKNQMNGKKKL